MVVPGSPLLDLGPYLSASRVIFFPAGTTKPQALEALSSLTASHPSVGDPLAFRVAIIEREQVASTGIGNGVAVPHAKLPTNRGFVISIGICASGIPFQARDNRDVFVLVMIAASDSERESYLKVLATVASRIKVPVVLEQLQAADNPESVVRVLRGEVGPPA